MHVSTSKCFCEAKTRALEERICESDCGKRKGSDCEAGISFSCMFQRANVFAKQKRELWKSEFASLIVAKEKQATAKPAFAFQGELTSKCFCEAETKALQERICESNQLKRKANNCEAKTRAWEERICESDYLKIN